MSAEQEQVEAIEREFGLDSANSFIEIDERVEKLAAALAEARAERDALLGNRDPRVMRCPECDDRKCHVNCAEALRTQLADVQKAMHAYRKAAEEKGTQLAAARGKLTALGDEIHDKSMRKIASAQMATAALSEAP